MDPIHIPSFSPAGQPEILRAFQRDHAQLSQLFSLTQHTFRALFGSRDLLPQEHILHTISSLIYYGLTFGLGTQTIGEEYTDILPFALTNHQSPTRARRLTTLALTLVTPPLLQKLLKYLRLRHQQAPRAPTETSGVERRIWEMMEKAEKWVPLLGEIHLALFFLGGRFFEFGKRIGGVGYISLLPQAAEPSQKPTYSILGVLLLLPLLNRLRHLLPSSPSARSSSQDSPTEPESNSKFYLPDGQTIPWAPAQLTEEPHPADRAEPKEEREIRKCTLCLEGWKAPCVIECGHVFCWDCLGEWRREKEECPLCRQPLNSARLLPLYNV